MTRWHHRATYAHRFNARAITRPRLAPSAMTDEQFAEHLATLPSELTRTMAAFVRSLYRSYGAGS